MPVYTDEQNRRWFREKNDRFFPGQEFSLEIDEILYENRSIYQNILVFKSKTYGNVLVLDNYIQCTERDEFAYQEMVAFLPLLVHPNPKRVLIIGGGDGGVIREVLKHPKVEKVVLCELDEEVIDVSRKYLPHMSQFFDDPKVRIEVINGFDYLKEHREEFDVIIVDSSDPDGPAEALFEQPFYSLMKSALRKPHGIICTQAECIWLDLPLIKKLTNIARELFPSFAYANISIPTYTCGTIGFLVCSLDPNAKITEPIDVELANQLNTKYYSANIHRACFVLPEFARKELQ